MFFQQPGAGKPVSLRLPSRAHAEVVFTLARLGLHWAVHLPEGAPEVAALKAELDARLTANAARAQRLARSRTSDEQRVEDLARLLEHWLVHGRPERRTRRPDAPPTEPAP